MATLSLGLLAAQQSNLSLTGGREAALVGSAARRPTNPMQLGSAAFSTHVRASSEGGVDYLSMAGFSTRVASEEEDVTASFEKVWQPSLGGRGTSSDEPRVNNSIRVLKKQFRPATIAGALGVLARIPQGFPSERARVAKVEERTLPAGESGTLGNLLQVTEAQHKAASQQLIVSDASADAFAVEKGIQAAVLRIGELCILLVPSVSRVQVELHRDQDDETIGLHFGVRTRASVQQVLDAEDRLHLAIFEMIDVGEFPSFSIGYGFEQ